MEKCKELLIQEPESLKGRWMSWAKDFIDQPQALYLELGCGKGRFTVDTAQSLSNTLYVAIEKVPDAMIIAMERAMERELNCLRFIDGDAAKLADMFQPGEVSRIYINFCDPWPKSRDAKFRLTYPGFLRIYSQLLPLGGQIHFKTDNLPLFRWSIQQFQQEGWALHEVTEDLHGEGQKGYMTDYEAKFVDQGMKINRLVAEKTCDTKDLSAPSLERMRNAALTDARGYEESMRSSAQLEQAE